MALGGRGAARGPGGALPGLSGLAGDWLGARRWPEASPHSALRLWGRSSTPRRPARRRRCCWRSRWVRSRPGAAGRAGRALGLAAGCGLVRVEAWPFIAAFGILLWRCEPGLHRALLATALLEPAVDPSRAGRLRRSPAEWDPRPGTERGSAGAGRCAVPGLARDRAASPLWCLWIGVAVLVIDGRRAAGRPALILIGGPGAAWLAARGSDVRARLLGAALFAAGSRPCLPSAARWG